MSERPSSVAQTLHRTSKKVDIAALKKGKGKMGPTVSAPARIGCLRTALAAYKADFASMPPSLQPEAYDLVEQDLQAIRCLVTNATPAVKERWRSLVDAHVSLTGAILGNFLAIAIGHVKPMSEGDLTRLRDAHASALTALEAVE